MMVAAGCMDHFDDYTRESFQTILVKGEIATSREWNDPFSASSDQDGSDEARFLKTLGFGKPYIDAFQRKAAENGSTLEDELLASGMVTADAYFGAFARYLRLPFLAEINPAHLADVPHLDTQLLETRFLKLAPEDSKPILVIVPELRTIEALKDMLSHTPHLLSEIAVATPKTMRDAVWIAGKDRRNREARQALFEKEPTHSARITVQAGQGFCSGVLVTLIALALLADTPSTLLALHATLTLFYLSTFLFRCFALAHCWRGLPSRIALSHPKEREMPIYTVLVALYREEAVAAQLIAMLDRLDWPKSRLDIKLICEEDDEATIRAIQKANPGPHMEIVRVPFSLPQTKPKALTYALAGARGEFVAIYDAEDRPQAEQLREAYATFQSQPDNVACLQAPLIISNARASWLSTCFALEYAGLFRCMLPVLARYKLPLPLGGTSNHFRTALLRQAGAWDPYNVTEDADIGLRLHRLGYRSGIICRQTLEDAPTSVSVWLNQRTRWYKGWLQSWLVLTRAPVQTAGKMGWLAYLIFQLLIGGMLLSSLAHPLLLLSFIAMTLAMLETSGSVLFTWQGGLFCIDMVNIIGSYTVFILLGRKTMTLFEREHLGNRWLIVPVYWILLSIAAWRALIELRTKPFVWNKTPHTPMVTNPN